MVIYIFLFSSLIPERPGATPFSLVEFKFMLLIHTVVLAGDES